MFSLFKVGSQPYCKTKLDVVVLGTNGCLVSPWRMPHKGRDKTALGWLVGWPDKLPFTSFFAPLPFYSSFS